MIKEEHDFMTSALRRDEGYKPRGYKSLISSMAKAKAFDALLTKYNAAKAELDKLKKS